MNKLCILPEQPLTIPDSATICLAYQGFCISKQHPKSRICQKKAAFRVSGIQRLVYCIIPKGWDSFLQWKNCRVIHHNSTIDQCLGLFQQTLFRASGCSPQYSPHVEHIDAVRYVNLPLVHVVQHFFRFRHRALTQPSQTSSSPACPNRPTLMSMLPARVRRFCASRNASLKRVLPQRGDDSVLPYHGLTSVQPDNTQNSGRTA